MSALRMGNGSSSDFSVSSQFLSNEMSTATPQGVESLTQGYCSWTDKDEDRQGSLLSSSAVKKKHHVRMPLNVSAGNMFESLLCTDRILKFFIVIFYGILPCWFQNHFRKAHYSSISLIFVLLQWNGLINFIHFVVTYWTSEDSELKFSKTVLTLMITNAVSVTVTYSLAIHYFYRKKNNFSDSNKGKWSVIPSTEFNLHDDKALISPKRQDWLLTNLFLFIGLSTVASLGILNHIFKTFYGVHGIQDFLSKIPWLRQLQFRVASCTTTFGTLASTFTCCVFYAVTRDMVRHIEYTEKVILEKVRNRCDFYFYHHRLHQYTDKMVASLREWFAVHSFSFITMVVIFVSEWFKLTKHKKVDDKYFYYLLITQIAGSLMVAFKLAFPFISASRVTSRFNKFYFNIAMNCQVEGLPDLSILSRKSGFILYGLRINTATAILAFISCFASVFRTWYSLT